MAQKLAAYLEKKMLWHIEYAVTPTNFNTNVTIEHHGAIEDVVILREKSQTPHLKNRNPESHVIYKIWTGKDENRDVHYQDRGYSSPHISQLLRDRITAPAVVERLIA
jgi:hypothetical protein